MSRPCTDLPITRVSVTNAAATVVVVVVVVAAMVVDVVVGVVAGVVLVVVVGATVVAAIASVVVGSAVAGTVVDVVVDWLSDVDEQASTSCEMTSGVNHHGLRLIRGRSVGSDDHAAIAVRDLLALDHSADLGQELGDVGHEAVLRLDARADLLELRAGHQLSRGIGGC